MKISRRVCFVSSLFVLMPVAAVACEICGAPQPWLVRAFSHGTGPQGDSDYLIVLLALLLVAYALGHAVKCVMRPGEAGAAHIKRTILEQE